MFLSGQTHTTTHPATTTSRELVVCGKRQQHPCDWHDALEQGRAIKVGKRRSSVVCRERVEDHWGSKTQKRKGQRQSDFLLGPY